MHISKYLRDLIENNLHDEEPHFTPFSNVDDDDVFEPIPHYNSPFTKNGEIVNRPIPGRPCISTREEDAMLFREVKNHPFRTASQLKIASNFPGSQHTVRRFREHGIRCRRAMKREHLMLEHAVDRLAYATLRQNFDWRNIIFSDEVIVSSSNDGPALVYYKKIVDTDQESNPLSPAEYGGDLAAELLRRHKSFCFCAECRPSHEDSNVDLTARFIVNNHIVRAHPEVHRNIINLSYNDPVPNNEFTNSSSQPVSSTSPTSDSLHDNFDLKYWDIKFNTLACLDVSDNAVFDKCVEKYCYYLKQSVSQSKGPQHPATTYYKKRQARKNNPDGITYKQSNNPKNRNPDNIIITPEEIAFTYKGIKVDTAPGEDGVRMKVIKELHLYKPLSLNATYMLHWGHVPLCLRHPRTILIYKDGDPDIKNWHPITIYSVLRRIIERVLDIKLRSYLDLNLNQRGFMSGPGVSHQHIEQTLNAMPIPPKLKMLITSLLIGNSTTSTINKTTKTAPIMIKQGVAQGAPLSPILFNVAIDFVMKELSESNISGEYGYNISPQLHNLSSLAFADDLVLLCKNKSATQYSTSLTMNSLARIGLEVNPHKSNVSALIPLP
ncbi:hypothetical protein ANN_04440 [Periplaneta americana]|uniref:Reverse transcriptase domain-containing protein n=1 Tax=Periplaneta americana TaxID=6978 RepID=A0ABQ8TAL2_PERAM|nr:hypothetical protein ANN_04440 [Periplaneta americana]